MPNEALWCPDSGDGTFQNPILYADYSDPDVCRVGDTFYMTASSFNYIPGLPILTSKDLVNWELKNYALKERIPYDTYDAPAHSRGIYAPSIRYHNGEFYIFVGMPDEGIYMLKTKDPLGTWSDPYLVLPGKGYIDPCPFWDEDGTAYVIHAYAKSRIGFNSVLGIFQITPDGEHAISDDVFIYDGTKTNPVIEGPKVYKKYGYYYIFAPAGGVKYGWQTVLRSKTIYGPYEEKVVMHQGSSDINGPHQGGLVDTPAGEEWFIHFQDAGVYGRITHMQPVTWKEDWPIIGIDKEGTGCGEPQHSYPVPDCYSAPAKPLFLEASDDFSAPELALQWQWLANSNPNYYSLTERPGALRLYSINPTGKPAPILWHCANVLTQKLVCPSFTADFDIDISGLQENCQAGIIMIGGEYSALAFRKDSVGLQLVYFESKTLENNGGKTENILYSVPVDDTLTTATLRLTFDKDTICRMHYRFGTQNGFTELPFRFIPENHNWVGGRFGMFSTALESCDNHGFADFTNLVVTMTK